MKIEIATSIKYGNYKHLLPKAVQIIDALNEHLSNICKEIDFSRSVKIVIRPIRGRTHGQAFASSNHIEVDPRRFDLKNTFETLIHELVHNEQHKQKRLSRDVASRRWVWDKTKYRDARTHEEYLNYPWEIEARQRAGEYMKKYWP